MSAGPRPTGPQGASPGCASGCCGWAGRGSRSSPRTSTAGGGVRAGFGHMVAEVCPGKVGAVAAREVSRFSRSSRDWQQLVETCAMVTDKPASHGAATREVMPGVECRRHKGLNNRAENAHRPTRRRGRQMKRFESARHARRSLRAHDGTTTPSTSAAASPPSGIEPPGPGRPGPGSRSPASPVRCDPRYTRPGHGHRFGPGLTSGRCRRMSEQARPIAACGARPARLTRRATRASFGGAAHPPLDRPAAPPTQGMERCRPKPKQSHA